VDRPTIVLVDDEELVLTSIRSLIELETNYVCKPFTSAQAALDHISANDVNLVVSDYLMPEMDGISFLAKVRKVKPDIPRILLTGYADKENAIKAINEVGLFQYIEKPWDNNDLLLIFRNGLDKQLLMQKLQTKINEINKAYGDLDSLHREIMKTFV
jgi:DNA-binding NtrC family response regulator